MHSIIQIMALAAAVFTVAARAEKATTAPQAPIAPAAPAAPAAPQYGCDSVESRQFDFWVGDWEFTSGGKRGVNHVTKILGGCGILESFGDGGSDSLNGNSLSVFNKVTKKWNQAWIDNSASYIDASGGMEDGKMVLVRQVTNGGKTIMQRMIWFNIEKDRFSWSWDRSDDMGKTWRVVWPIEYRRIK